MDDHPEPSFNHAARVYHQVLLLLSHLLWVVREITNTAATTDCVGSEALICWSILVAILLMDKQSLVTIFSRLLPLNAEVMNTRAVLRSWSMKEGCVEGVAVGGVLPRILEGISSLETMIGQNLQAAPDYHKFFVELRSTIR